MPTTVRSGGVPSIRPDTAPGDLFAGPLDAGPGPAADATRVTRPVVDVVVPVYNEERDLEPNVRRLRRFLDADFPFAARVTIADNASTDGTWAIARRLADELPGVAAVHLALKGRGRALKETWLASDAEIVAYMDVDLSTDLRALLPLVAPLLSGHSQIAIGSRLAAGSHVARGPKREVISRTYNLILRTALRARFSDAQCGFKAMRADAARRLLPLVEDPAWFFDTELLVLAQRSGLRIHEVPVDWTDDPDSRVHIVSTATADLRGVVRLLRARRRVGPIGDGPGSSDGLVGGPGGSGSTGQPEHPDEAISPGTSDHGGVRRILGHLVPFAAIGVLSTLAYVALYAILRDWLPAAGANAVALVVTAVGNTAANRRITFDVRGGAGMARDQLAGLLAFGIALAITTVSVELLHATVPDAGRVAEIAVLVTANAAATAVRFLILRQALERRAGARPGLPPPAGGQSAARFRAPG
jgi:putative flippase GtrA